MMARFSNDMAGALGHFTAVHDAGESDMRALLIEAEGPNFSLGGAANSTASPGLSTNVGAQFSFRDRLTFSRDD